MKTNVTKSSSATDWARIDALADAEIDTSDITPLDDNFFAHAEVRMDEDVYQWFQSQSDAKERMSAALRICAEAHQHAA